MTQNATVNISYKIEGVGGGYQKLNVDAEALYKLLQANVMEVEKQKKLFMNFAVISNCIKNLDGSFSALNNTMSAVTCESNTFDKAMKAANTMADKDNAGFRELKDDVAELSKQIPIAQDELTNGLYQVISNGVAEDNWLEYLYDSARSASSYHHSFHVGKPILLIRRLVLPTAAMTSRMPLAMNNTVPISTNVLYAIRSSK